MIAVLPSPSSNTVQIRCTHIATQSSKLQAPNYKLQTPNCKLQTSDFKLLVCIFYFSQFAENDAIMIINSCCTSRQRINLDFHFWRQHLLPTTTTTTTIGVPLFRLSVCLSVCCQFVSNAVVMAPILSFKFSAVVVLAIVVVIIMPTW